MIGGIIYQIFPDRFYNGNLDNDPENIKTWGSEVDSECFMGGDIEGIIKKINYISDLGVTAIYLNPIFHSNSNHKYDTIDYFEIDPSFGTLDDFKTLLEICHQHGIKVIIDGVFNHTGTDFFAFKDILKNQGKSKYKDWYYVTSYPVYVKDNPPYKACGGAYFLPKLNTSNRDVQEYVIKVIKYWEQFGIDGIRLDVPFEIDVSLLKKIRKSTKMYIVGEVWGYGKRFVPEYFNGVTNYLFRDLLTKAVVNQCIDSRMFIDEWKSIEMQYKENIHYNINLAGSHDTQRILTLCDGNVKKEKLFYALLFFFPGIPLIYYGDEIGLEGANDPYCRGTMIWESKQWNLEIFNHIKNLIRLRKNYLALSIGEVKFLEYKERSLIFERYYKNNYVRIGVNFGFQDEKIGNTTLEPLSYKIIDAN